MNTVSADIRTRVHGSFGQVRFLPALLRRTALVLYFHGAPQIPRQVANHAAGDN